MQIENEEQKKSIMATGTINVQSENIFPIIKKFLYSDHEIFLRELVSNAVDATHKIKTLSRTGEFKGDLGELTIEIELDSKKKKLIIKDRGLGMTADEVEKYINQVAFSGAKEFMSKYEEKLEGQNMIGNFGLGFYSSFMVAKKVEIDTLSYQDGAEAAKWSCEGDPTYSLTKGKRKDRGTTITLHLADDSEEFAENSRIEGILSKYCKFLPVPIKFGTRKERQGEGDDAVEVEVDHIINNPNPAWTVAPSELKDEDYKSFFRELYPMNFDEPLFHIHLNVDYPFELTGVLFFPKIKENIEVRKDRIQLYCNQVFVTDSVEGIVPDFLTLLQGVIDSPDIPLNVSRSYLQSDSNVKKISSHITKKVADKLDEMFRNEREKYDKLWDDLKIIVEYGMLTEEKFYEKANKFALYKNVDGELALFEDYLKKIEPLQTDKDGQRVLLYTSDAKAQHSYIQDAKELGYDVLEMEGPIVSHLMQKLESEHEKITFKRIDSDSIEKLIAKDDALPSKLSEEEQKKVEEAVKKVLNDSSYTVAFESRSETAAPFAITIPEFIRRMKEMSQTGGGGFYGSMPDSYNLVVNSNHALIGRIQKAENEEIAADLIRQGIDLAKIAQNMLSGEELTSFVKRSWAMLSESEK
jgi:molecular chaperone HtpG